MKSNLIPWLNSMVLAAITAAGLCHWWSVRQLVSAIHMPYSNNPYLSLTQGSRQKDFYDALITKIDQLQSQNDHLLDQLTATQRDVSQMESRMATQDDATHTQITHELRQPHTNTDAETGVLPPRVEPALPSRE